MELDRDINQDGLGKYALIDIRKLKTCNTEEFSEVINSIRTLEKYNIIQWSKTGSDDEAFVIKLKDKYALPALSAYSEAAAEDDVEYANSIDALAQRSGINHPKCKIPD